MEVPNRFKGLDLIDRVSEELWIEVNQGDFYNQLKNTKNDLEINTEVDDLKKNIEFLNKNKTPPRLRWSFCCPINNRCVET